jgi:hypothetical protein
VEQRPVEGIFCFDEGIVEVDSPRQNLLKVDANTSYIGFESPKRKSLRKGLPVSALE